MKKTKKEVSKISVEELNEMFGGGFFTLDGGVENIERIPTGIPALDEAIGGGWPKGRIVELFGAEASGKTWLLIKTYAENQKRGAQCIHFDAEQSFSTDFAKTIGLKLDNSFILNQPDMYAEKLFQAIISLCGMGNVDIIGIDSTAALIPKAEMEGELEDERPGVLAKVMSKAMRQIANAAATNGVTIFFINQMREKIGGFGGGFGSGPVTYTPGGRSLKHYASVRVEVKKKFIKKSDRPDLYNGDRQIGHVMSCKVVKNKTAPPFKTCETDLLYEAKSKIVEAIEKALKSGILDRSSKNHRKISYKSNQVILPDKGNWDFFINWLKESNLLLQFLEEVDGESFDINEYLKFGCFSGEELKSRTPKKIKT